MAQRVKNLALSLKWLESMLWHVLDPWSGDFDVPQARPKKIITMIIIMLPGKGPRFPLTCASLTPISCSALLGYLLRKKKKKKMEFFCLCMWAKSYLNYLKFTLYVWRH